MKDSKKKIAKLAYYEVTKGLQIKDFEQFYKLFLEVEKKCKKPD